MPNEFLGTLYLASASPRRKELLAGLGLDFQIALSAQPEPVHPAKINNFNDLGMVMAIAEAKARGAWETFVAPKPSAGLVLAADTLVFLGDRVLGKPKDARHAREILRALSGKTHTVATGVSLLRILAGEIHHHENRMVTTNVTFSALHESDIDWYIETGEPMDKAGAYGAQGYGTVFIEKISGSYTNVVGLPLTETMDLIREACGVPWQAFSKAAQ